MTAIQLENFKKQYIYDAKGNAEYVVLSISDYQRLIDLLEDYALGDAMLAAEDAPRYGKEEALKFLENDTD